MAVYCYTNDRGDKLSRQYPMGKAPRRIEVDGSIYRRDFRAEFCGKHTPGNWPMASDAAGVHPGQVDQAHEHARRVGIPTEFTADGRAIFTSRRHRRDYCRAIGLHDRNAGYSDP